MRSARRRSTWKAQHRNTGSLLKEAAPATGAIHHVALPILLVRRAKESRISSTLWYHGCEFAGEQCISDSVVNADDPDARQSIGTFPSAEDLHKFCRRELADINKLYPKGSIPSVPTIANSAEGEAALTVYSRAHGELLLRPKPGRRFREAGGGCHLMILRESE